MLSFDEKKQLLDELRKEWRMMWWERIDDHVRAEGITDKDYSKLFVDQGTVIIATRKFRPPDFYDILQRHMMRDVNEVAPPPSVGGWGKFIRTNLQDHQLHKGRRRRSAPPKICRKKGQQQKKGGRGWLHFTR